MDVRRPEYARIRVALGASASFGVAAPANLDALAAAGTLERYDRVTFIDSPVLRQDKLWLVLEGSLIGCYLNVALEPVPITILAPGSFYNSAALVEDGLRLTQARTQPPETVLAAFPGATLRALAQSDIGFSNCVSRLLQVRFLTSLGFYADAIAAPLGDRIIRRILGQVFATRMDAGNGEVELHLSQANLALTLGASRSKVNAELRHLERLGALRLGYRTIHVRDVAKLTSLVPGPVLAF